jgi:hypothetical protein
LRSTSEDLRRRVQGADEVLDTSDLFFRDHISLVEKNDIGELDLIGKTTVSAGTRLSRICEEVIREQLKHDLQIGDVPLILRRNLRAMSVRQEVRRVEITQESRTVHHTDASIQTSDL